MSKYVSLETFKGYKGKIDFEKICEKYAKKTTYELKAISPKDSKKRKNGKYKDTWVYGSVRHGNEDVEFIVWNEKNWQLTHLLENGHLIVNKKNGVGWASPKPHIRPAFLKYKDKFFKEMKKAQITLKEK